MKWIHKAYKKYLESKLRIRIENFRNKCWHYIYNNALSNMVKEFFNELFNPTPVLLYNRTVDKYLSKIEFVPNEINPEKTDCLASFVVTDYPHLAVNFSKKSKKERFQFLSDMRKSYPYFEMEYKNVWIVEQTEKL